MGVVIGSRRSVHWPGRMDIDWSLWAYVAACVAVPAAWGAACAWLFGRLDRRRRSSGAPPRERSFIDYSI